MTDQQYIDKYINEIETQPNNTKELFSIGIIGLNGSGKSTFANALGEKLNLYVASNDRIRRWLNEHSFEGESPAQDLLQKIAEASSRYLYENRISHIIDADLIKFHQNAKTNAANYDASLHIIHITIPEDIAIQRLEKRIENIQNGRENGLSMVGPDEYMRRKKIHSETDLPQDILLTIDGSYDIIENVDKTIQKLKEINAIA